MKHALLAGFMAGVITLFEDQEEVRLMDATIFSGLVRVRRKGDVAEYWTSGEAID